MSCCLVIKVAIAKFYSNANIRTAIVPLIKSRFLVLLIRAMLQRWLHASLPASAGLHLAVGGTMTTGMELWIAQYFVTEPIKKRPTADLLDLIKTSMSALTF